jgi:selenocysteine-specific elongation factor
MANSADVKALSSRSAANMDIFTYLKYREFIVKINEERYMLKDAYIKAKKALLGYFETHEMIDVASYRDLLATSRKNSVMLLEHFDEIGLTKRIENIRVLNK